MEAYDQITATHYAAYRPPLHEFIIKKALGEQSFETALDVGCGTGRSSIALTSHVQHVVGIDISPDMIANAQPHPQVVYHTFDGQTFPVQDHGTNLVTFAGSLFYAKSQATLDEVIRVSRPGAVVLAYDFDVIQGELLEFLELPAHKGSNYRHDEDFSGLESNALELLEQKAEPISLAISSENLLHLLLSDKDNYLSLKKIYDDPENDAQLRERLMAYSTNHQHALLTDIYFTSYKIHQ